MGKVLISPDEDNFTPSSCDCEFCQDMHKSLREWYTFTAKTAVQRNMLRVVKTIEKVGVEDNSVTQKRASSKRRKIND